MLAVKARRASRPAGIFVFCSKGMDMGRNRSIIVLSSRRSSDVQQEDPH